jgi:predicted P-loop ATPase
MTKYRNEDLESLGEQLRDLRQVVDRKRITATDYVANKRPVFHKASGEWRFEESYYSRDILGKRLWLLSKKEGHKFQLTEILAALEISEDEEEKRIWHTLRERVAFDPSAVDHLDEFLFHGFGIQNKLASHTVRHAIWNVKQKLNGRHGRNHVFVVFTGAQGIGKSEATKKLVSPIVELVSCPPNTDFLTDDKRSHLFRDSLVIICDEMGKFQKQDEEAVKTAITEETRSFRPNYAVKDIRIRNNVTLLGSSNYRLTTLLNDSTGARRFFELNIQGINHQIVNQFNYLELWKSINENGPSPLEPFLDDLRAYQEKELRPKSQIEEWFEARTEIGTDAYTLSETAYESFVNFLEFQRVKQIPSIQKFGRDLTSLLEVALPKQKIKDRTANKTVYKLRIRKS